MNGGKMAVEENSATVALPSGALKEVQVTRLHPLIVGFEVHEHMWLSRVKYLVRVVF